MIKLLVIFILVLFLAYRSEQYTQRVQSAGGTYRMLEDQALVAMIVVLCLFTGLRTSYNDTWNYIRGFNGAGTLSDFFADPENLNLFKNPLFYFYQSAIKTIFNNAQVMIFLSSVFTQICFIRFFKRYSETFTFSVFLYFTLGTFCLSMGAMKQVLAMAIMTLAFPCMERKQWVRYYLVVFIAMLIHTYALAFAILPIFTQRPWKHATFLVMLVLLMAISNFRTVIGEFMDQANELGKTLEEYEVFDDHTVNLFRLAVYAVPPLLSLVFMHWVFVDSTKTDHLLVNMSILSLAFMSLGTQAGANMFGRMGNYFELGTICCLPWMLKKTFKPGSSGIVVAFAAICFFGFFVYQNMIAGSFDQMYQMIRLW